VGQVGEWKGHEDLVEALKLLDEQGQKFELKIFGAGEQEFTGKLKSKISNYGIAHHVKWMGFTKQREEIYEGLDVCVVPSRFHEAFGLVAAEALASGVPVIATKQGALPEIVQDKRTGFLIDSRAPEQLAEKLSLLVRSSAIREEVARCAKDYARTKLSDHRMAEEIESVLQSIVNGKTPSHSSLN
jgi:glycosyltransferase involved in cell wall biosynthesis